MEKLSRGAKDRLNFNNTRKWINDNIAGFDRHLVKDLHRNYIKFVRERNRVAETIFNEPSQTAFRSRLDKIEFLSSELVVINGHVAKIYFKVDARPKPNGCKKDFSLSWLSELGKKAEAMINKGKPWLKY